MDTDKKDLPLQSGDFYFDPDGRMVLTAQYLLRRGFCCSNGCRHCPYEKKEKVLTPVRKP